MQTENSEITLYEHFEEDFIENLFNEETQLELCRGRGFEDRYEVAEEFEKQLRQESGDMEAIEEDLPPIDFGSVDDAVSQFEIDEDPVEMFAECETVPGFQLV